MKQYQFILFFFISLADLRGQGHSIFDQIQEKPVSPLSLSLPWKDLEKKKLDKAYLTGQLTTCTGDDIKTFPVKVRTRGNMRLNICDYPPLKIKFDKGMLAGMGFSENNEIDLVHHCHDDELYDQLILREYLAYKLYQEISPLSFEAHLVNVTYLNPDSSLAHDPAVGFIVENSEELVSRLGGKRNKTAIMSQNAVEKASFLQICLFQYMIGNTDWNVKNRHNLEFIQVPGYAFLVPVPYDFDYAGLVSAPYAAHHESINLPSVSTRYYQGKCVPKAEADKVIQTFLSKKDRLLEICYEIPGLSERSLKHVTGYLNEFFEILENPKKTENYILNQCDRWPVEQ